MIQMLLSWFKLIGSLMEKRVEEINSDRTNQMCGGLWQGGQIKVSPKIKTRKIKQKCWTMSLCTEYRNVLELNGRLGFSSCLIWTLLLNLRTAGVLFQQVISSFFDPDTFFYLLYIHYSIFIFCLIILHNNLFKLSFDSPYCLWSSPSRIHFFDELMSCCFSSQAL